MMMDRTSLKAIKASAVAFTLVISAPAVATPVYDQVVTAADYMGSRSTGGGGLDLTISGNPGNPPTAMTFSWNISFNGGTNLWSYKYTFDFTPDNVQAISHFILDLSDDCTANTGCVINETYTNNSTGDESLEFGSFSSGSGNPNMNGNIVGVKFDETNGVDDFMVEFDSERAPVWGDFYTKAGSQNNGWQLQNTGISLHATSMNILDFVARPNGAGPPPPPPPPPNLIPEPGPLTLFGLGLLGLAYLRRRLR